MPAKKKTSKSGLLAVPKLRVSKLMLSIVVAVTAVTLGFVIRTSSQASAPILWGGSHIQTTEGALMDYERSLGRSFAVLKRQRQDLINIAVANGFQYTLEDDRRAGRLSLYYLGAETSYAPGYQLWKDIPLGVFDEQLRHIADVLKVHQTPVYLSLSDNPESKTTGQYPQGTPEQYKAAWKYFRNYLTAQGVTNAKYVLALDASTYAQGKTMSWYPGDAVIDIVGSAGYNNSCINPGSTAPPPASCMNRWKSFETIFTPTRDFANAHNKNFWVVATGTTESIGTNSPSKAGWFRAMATTAQKWPRLRAIIYDDARWGRFEYRAESSTASLQAYRSIGLSPYFQARYPYPVQ